MITINSNHGSDNTKCCVKGKCVCSSLSTALLNIDSNTIINIKSESVTLNNTTTMGSGKLTNITITGSNVTIMCNNSGSVYCKLCNQVRIEGITWDRCGEPNGTNIAGVTFNITSNISLVNCTFQNSQIPAVALKEIADNILIQGCTFLSNIPTRLDHNCGILSITRYLYSSFTSSHTITIFESYFYNNGFLQNNVFNPFKLSSLYIKVFDRVAMNCKVILKKSTFLSNRNCAFFIEISIMQMINMQLTEVLVSNNTFFRDIGVSVDLSVRATSSKFNGNYSDNVWHSIMQYQISVTINNSNFTDNQNSNTDLLVFLISSFVPSKVTCYSVQFNNNLGGIVIAHILSSFKGDVEINMYMVNFTHNQYLGSALLISLTKCNNSAILQKNCEFANNQSPDQGAVLYILTKNFADTHVQIQDTNFNQNIGGNVIYIPMTQSSFTLNVIKIKLIVNNLTFTNNVGSSMYLSACDMKLSGNVLFKNNTAENGGAMYLDQRTTVTIDDEASVQFIGNAATLNGGAIYVDLLCDKFQTDANTFLYHTVHFSALFINNSALITGNSLYFSVNRFCSVNTNINNSGTLLYVPCHFNYSQPVNGKMMDISCDLDYTLLNGTVAPIVTSPHELRLYFPFNDGYNISSTSDHNVYFIRNNILGHPVKFTGAVFDYFGKPAEPTLFSIQLKYSSYILIGGNDDNILTQSIDNFTILNINLKGKRIDVEHINLTVTLKSLSTLFKMIITTLLVEIIPCTDHPGYTYNGDSQVCICYHANVKCNTNGNEIKRGHWFGNIGNKATTSLCPNHYCKFINRKHTSKGYFALPNTINAQCNDHRVGRACGECSSGYTLSYDSTNCISVDQCGIGWTVLVIMMTCLYWITVVVGVFSLMYFKFQISLGYLYGLVYYYSMVGTLWNNNMYISDDAFQFVSVLSSFAQLTPQFLGKLCFVKGLSGIDQLFIHYSHAVAVSLLLLLIVIAARCSARITLFVSRCIIRVICLLILLSYTSIASTSLQLLLPLRFTDFKEWYTYSSPHIQYFHGRHALYGVVAVFCQIIVGIGLPLLLLLEPVLNRKINFIKIKPLLDQFQACYKDKYRWFASYYLICRQVIFLIVYIFSSNYYGMLFYLQAACVIIAMIHMWFRPYQNELLNALDGVMLLLIILEANIYTLPFLKNITTEIALIMVTIPLILFSTIAIKNVFRVCLKKWYYHHHDPIDDDYDFDERLENFLIRYIYVCCI